MKYSKELHERVLQRIRDQGEVISFGTPFVECLLDEITRLQEERRWIPASDPPKVSERYLCYDKEYGRMTYAWVDKSWWYGDRMCSRDDYVTHWMPLPPQEGLK
jgi:hypothetical protein